MLLPKMLKNAENGSVLIKLKTFVRSDGYFIVLDYCFTFATANYLYR